MTTPRLLVSLGWRRLVWVRGEFAMIRRTVRDEGEIRKHRPARRYTFYDIHELLKSVFIA
jgi:hypothetical protein